MSSVVCVDEDGRTATDGLSRTCSGQSCLLLSALPEYIPNMAGFDGQSKMILRKSIHNLAFNYDSYD